MKASAHLILFAVLVVILPLGTAGAPLSWNTDASGQWTTGSNWTGGVAPSGADDVTINRPSANPAVTLSGGGTQSISSLANHEVLNINGTNLVVGAAGAAGAVTGGGAINVFGGGVLTVNALDQQQLSIGAGVQVVVRPEANGASGAAYLRALSIAGGGFLDLTDNDLVVDYAAASPFDAVHNLVQAGSFGGFGIGSSLAPPGSDRAFTCYEAGYAGLTQWPAGSGHLIDSTTIIAAFTYAGDVNSDFQVDTSDLAIVDANLGTTPALLEEAWLKGDMDYDGSVTLADRAIVLENQGAGVPEPAALPALTLALGVLAHGRRRPRTHAEQRQHH